MIISLNYGVHKIYTCKLLWNLVIWCNKEHSNRMGSDRKHFLRTMLSAESKKNARFNRIKKWPKINTFNSSKQLSKNITMHGQDLCVIWLLFNWNGHFIKSRPKIYCLNVTQSNWKLLIINKQSEKRIRQRLITCVNKRNFSALCIRRLFLVN